MRAWSEILWKQNLFEVDFRADSFATLFLFLLHLFVVAMSVYFHFVSQKSIHNYAKRICFAARDVVAPVFLVAVAFFAFLNVITCTKLQQFCGFVAFLCCRNVKNTRKEPQSSLA